MGTLKQAVDRVTAAKTAIGNAITAKGGTVAAGDGLEDFAADIATITNQYTAGDEGKVVAGGALVAQTAYPSTITANNTYDTTNYNSVTVNVSSGTPSSVTAQLYNDSAFTTTVKGYITVYNSTIIVSGVLAYSSNAKNYYINPTDLQLSDYLSSDKTITLQSTSSTSVGTVTGTLSVSNNLISTKLNSGGGGTTALFGTKTIA